MIYAHRYSTASQKTRELSSGIKWQDDLQVAVADPLITFQRRSAGEVAGPEIVSIVCVGEEIVRLQSPDEEK